MSEYTKGAILMGGAFGLSAGLWVWFYRLMRPRREAD